MEKAYTYSLAAFIILFVTGFGCGRDSDNQSFPGGWTPPGSQAVSVEARPVTKSSISEQIRSFGTIRSQEVVSIIPQVSNRIVHIYADLGDKVQEGDILAKIHDVPFKDAQEQAQAQLRQSRAALERDSLAYDRQRQLYERSASSSSELDNARSAYESSKAQYESARAALTQSRENLENTEIRSPVNGVVLNRSIAVGDLARTGEPAYEIANLTGYEVRLHLPLHDWEAVQVGMPVDMAVSNREDMKASGTVSRMSPQLNSTTGLGEVVVTLTDAGRPIRQGVLVEARITLVTHEQTVVIPRSTMVEQVDTYIEPETNTVELARNYYAFVAVGDTVAERREIELGIEQGERVEVLSGLDEGEVLIVTGQRNLSDGARVRIAGRDGSQSQEQQIEIEDNGNRDQPRGEGRGRGQGIRGQGGNR